MDYDLIVIGGGAGGLAAARSAARRKARTLLVQRGPLGGDCTFTGCVPSKSLIESAARGVGFTEAMSAVRRAVEIIAATEDDEVLRGQGVDVLHGRARFRSSREIEVDGRRLRAPRVVVATGAEPLVPPIEGLDNVAVLTNENVFALTEAPGSMAVLGGGPIGCELAQAFSRLGSKVTLIEGRDRILTTEEPETSRVLTEVFTAEGIDVRVGQQVVKAQPAGPAAAVRLIAADGTSVYADRVLVSVGRRPVTDGLDLEAAGVALDQRGFVRADRHLATSAAGVFAVGDVAGSLQLTHAADQMGRLAVANALGRRPWRVFRPERIGWVTYTDPEVGRVGMTEAEAVEHGGRVAYLPMSEVDRAVTAGRTAGFVKLIAGPRLVSRGLGGGRLLGATVVSARGGEMVAEVALAMRTRMFTGRLAQTVHPYPTWTMAVQQATAQFFFEIGGRRARPASGGGTEETPGEARRGVP